MSIEANIEEITSNVKGINSRLDDIRKLFTDHRVREVFIQSQCNHIKGSYTDGVSGRSYLGTESDNKPNYKYHKLFYFCPECGSKIR